MNRHTRTRIMVEGNPCIAHDIASQVQDAFVVNVLEEPSECLVMLKVRESAQRSLFYLGEALATSSRVSINETQGIGLVLGSNKALALNLAIADAAFQMEDMADQQAAWETILEKEDARLAQAAQDSLARTQATRVDFSTMEVDL